MVPKYKIGEYIYNSSPDLASISNDSDWFSQHGRIGVVIDRKFDDNISSRLFGAWVYLVAYNVGVYGIKAEDQISTSDRMLESSKAKLKSIFSIESRDIKLNALIYEKCFFTR